MKHAGSSKIAKQTEIQNKAKEELLAIIETALGDDMTSSGDPSDYNTHFVRGWNMRAEAVREKLKNNGLA